MARRTLIGSGGAGGGGEDTSFTRSSIEVTVATLDPDEDEVTEVSLPVGYRLYAVLTTRPARVRLYTDPSSQTADQARAIGVDPAADAGVVLDYVTEEVDTFYFLSPLVDGANLADLLEVDEPNVPITITNLDDEAGQVVVNLTYLRTE